MIIQSVFPAVERIFKESGGVMEEGTVTCFCLLKYMFLQQRYMCGIGECVRGIDVDVYFLMDRHTL